MFVLAAVVGISGLIFQRSFKKQVDVLIGVIVRKLVLADTIARANSEMISTQRGLILAAFAKDNTELAAYQQTFKQNVEVIQKSVEEIRPLGSDPEARRKCGTSGWRGLAGRVFEPGTGERLLGTSGIA
jgi:hypothetical protein